jgi:hypothetical protein
MDVFPKLKWGGGGGGGGGWQQRVGRRLFIQTLLDPLENKSMPTMFAWVKLGLPRPFDKYGDDPAKNETLSIIAAYKIVKSS